MKTGRRQDPDGLRRIPRDRDVAMGRVRKRPSMLLEFQGKHYNHRDTNRERFYHRYDQHDSSSGIKSFKRDRYGPTSGGFFKSELMTDSRSSGSNYRPLSSSHYHHHHHHHPTPTSYQDVIPMDVVNNHGDMGSVQTKRPRLLCDMELDTPDSVTSSFGNVPLVEPAIKKNGSPSRPNSPPQGLGLSAYLEDIESDEENDLLMVDEDNKPPQPISPLPLSRSLHRPSISSPPKQPSTSASSASGQMTKEQLLLRMEAVDREIAATESQIAALLKRQAELEGTVQSKPFTTPSPHTLSLSTIESEDRGLEEDRVASGDKNWVGPKRSLLETMYSENKLKARNAHGALHHLLSLPPSSELTLPLYNQPWEAPGYFNIIKRHQHFRSQLVELIQRQRRQKHDVEVDLCKKYDDYAIEWKKRLDKIENSSKRKARDQRNRELFERTFPELKLRREQQERLMRVDQRGYGIVRSELELSQVMCELIEQEEAPARTRRTHALIPAMVVGCPEERLSFHSTNGLIQDPMALYRAAKITNIWTDEEKNIFREKYALYLKNFEAISSFLPCKTTADCVSYYYLAKKNERFKQIARKTTFKRRKFIKPCELSGLIPHTPARLGVEPKIRSPLLSEVMTPRTPPTTTTATPITPRQDEVITKTEVPTPKPSRYGDWSDEDIDNLRAGLRKWGRAWSKIYREVAGKKTATQCKQFFDDFSHDESLGLTQALSERSSIQNAEKARRKAASRKPMTTTSSLARKRLPSKVTKPLQHIEQESENERVGEGREGESEAMESVSNCEMVSADDESGSESTITDSSPEDNATVPSGSTHSSLHCSWKSHTSSVSPSQATSDKGTFDIFISAAEALNNIVPQEVALHDHNYALAPLNSVDMQGSSGLSLIAAAAAVVSPTLSRSAGSGKFPAVSPVRAPRGRPPNTQRRGTGGSTCKLSPTFLSPAGSNIYVPLTDTTKSSFRSRTKSAPSDRPRIQLSRAGPSNLRYSITSKPSSPRPILPPASYTRTKDTTGYSNSTGGAAPSLKSMIASRPPPANSSNAAFETLVNVAVAASPAELPKTTMTQQQPPTLSISFQQNSSSSSAPATPATTGAPLSDGMYSIDMSQAINILTLAHLAQNPVSTVAGSKSTTQQLLLTSAGVGSSQATSGFLGTIVSQNDQVDSGGVKTTSPGSVNVLIGHLTSGCASPGSSTHSDSSVSTKCSPSMNPEPRHSQKPSIRQSQAHHHPTPTTSSHSTTHTPSSSSTEDLTNLNLLSSLVAVVAGSQPSPSPQSHPPPSIHTSHTTHNTSPDVRSYSITKNTTSVNLPILSLSSSTSAPRSSPFKATNLPASLVNSSTKSKEINSSRTKMHEKPTLTLSPLATAEHYRSSRQPASHARPSATNNSSSSLDNLARSVVRSSALTQSTHSTTNSTSSHAHPPSHPTYPSPTPSISQQSTLLLYTRSLSLPNASNATHYSSEDEDHLESASRGISELSKLLGTDTGSPESLTASETSSYRNSWGDQQQSSLRTSRTPRSAGSGGGGAMFSTKGELSNDSTRYLSGLLESHTSHSQKTSSNTDITNNTTHNLSSR